MSADVIFWQCFYSSRCFQMSSTNDWYLFSSVFGIICDHVPFMAGWYEFSVQVAHWATRFSQILSIKLCCLLLIGNYFQFCYTVLSLRSTNELMVCPVFVYSMWSTWKPPIVPSVTAYTWNHSLLLSLSCAVLVVFELLEINIFSDPLCCFTFSLP